MALPIFGAPAAVSLVNRALFNTSPANSVYLNQVATAGTNSASEYAFAGQLGASYAVGKTPAELASMILANVGISATTIPAKSFEILLAAGEDYIAFHGTENIGIIALQFGQIISGLENDATFGAAAKAWNQEVLGAYNYSINPANTTDQAGEGTAGNSSILLSVVQDNLTGTAGADTFTAHVVQNALGQQVNTLGSGDVLNGGQGYDTLVAKVTSGVFAGGSNMAIQPITNSVESIKLEAVWNGDNNSVVINAKDMVDVTYIGSEASDADLTILNMTTRRGNEVKAEGDLNGKLAETTIGMKYTNNQGTGSDLTVKYDQDYLVGATSAVDGYRYDLLDQAAYDANSNTPLAGFPLTGVNFTLTTGTTPQNYSLKLTKAEMEGIDNHAQLVQLLNQKLAETYPDLKDLTFKLQGEFSDSEGLRTSDRIALVDTDAGDRTVSGGNIELDTAQGAGNLYWAQGPVDRVTTAIPVSIKVELEKVGLAGEGGALVIGSMNDGGTNTFNPTNITTTTNTVSGIEEFNVTVVGDKSKSSSLTGLHSTNNNLRTVNVTSTVQTDAAANLTIGNTNSNLAGGNQGALKDVKTFDASAFKGDLTLHAALTNEVVAKYLKLGDKAPAAPDADNAAFMYTGGTGNDTINLQVSAGNLAKQGTATREDMTVSIAGGAGNDKITLSVVDNGTANLANGTGQAWYANQKLHANLSINAGDGNDTISTLGSGDVKIDAGNGDDTVYADNTGAKATWVLNATATGNLLANIESSANDSYQLFKTKVAISFKGFEATADVVDNRGIATDLDINQAIKQAIKDSPTLSKLLSVEDGPSNTLVITSLIDGAVADADALGFTLVAPTTLTAAEITQLTAWYGAASNATTIQTVVTEFNTPIVPGTETYNKELALSGIVGAPGPAITGTASNHVADNTITGGLGNDVLVLGTGANSNDTLKYAAGQFGNDKIVNFTVGDAAVLNADKLDFTSWLNNTTKAAAPALEVRVGTELKAGAVALDANDVTIISFGDLTTAAGTAFAAGTTFANLTDVQMLAALNQAGGFTVAATTDLVGTVQHSLVFVENAAGNAGEYKVYEVTSTNVAGENFTGATLVGTLDFGATQAFDELNFA